MIEVFVGVLAALLVRDVVRHWLGYPMAYRFYWDHPRLATLKRKAAWWLGA